MQILAFIAVIVGDLVIIGGALAWGWRRLDSVRQMAVDWHGSPKREDPTGTVIEPARPGVQGRLVRLETAQADIRTLVNAIDKELHPNSGSSFRDVVRSDIAALQVAVAELREERRQRPVVEAGGIGFQAEIA